MNDLGQLVNLFVDLLQRRHLDDLIDRLLNHRSGVLVDVIGVSAWPRYGMCWTSLTASSFVSTWT